MGNNLKRLRNAARLTLDEAAEAMGISRGGYIKLERGERRLNEQYIDAAAIVFGVSPGDVISEKSTVPLVGYVGAGAIAHYYTSADDPNEEVPMPENGNEQTVAVEARGDSLGSFFNQWLVYYDDVRHPPTADMIGKLCVVQLLDGRVLVKKLMRGSAPGLYHLLSQFESPIEDAEIEWAAKVTAMTPR